MPAPPAVILDDRLLIEELLVGLRARPTRPHTTTYWYYRACRAAVPWSQRPSLRAFDRLTGALQASAVASLLRLPDHIGLPEPRRTVPAMVDLARRHPKLNLLNLEAAAAARSLDAAIWLSPDGAAGVLAPVLEAEGIAWTTVPYP